MNPYTYQRPKITPLPNETGLTVPGGTGVAVVPNGTPPALKQPYLPGQYTEYPAAVQGWAQQALPGGGSGIDVIQLSKNNIQHIKKHTFEGMLEQAKYLTDEQLANKLANTSFFNKNWSQDEVVKYTQEAYNILRSQGKTGIHSVEINGEIINVFIKDDGTFDTAYGEYQ